MLLVERIAGDGRAFIWRGAADADRSADHASARVFNPGLLPAGQVTDANWGGGLVEVII